MSEEPLYEIARRRIQQRNRRWTLWGVNFLAFLMYVGAFTAFSGIPRNVGEFILRAWFGVLVLHTTALVMTQDQEENIESEVAKLRNAVDSTQKPKRREFSEYGASSESVEVAKSRISRS